MDLTLELKETIDRFTHYDLLSRWRSAPVGDEMFQGESGEYWRKRMGELRDKDPEQAVANSKALS